MLPYLEMRDTSCAKVEL